MTIIQIWKIRGYMLRHKDKATSATQLAEDAARFLDIEHELDDETSEIWDLALEYFDKAAE